MTGKNGVASRGLRPYVNVVTAAGAVSIGSIFLLGVGLRVGQLGLAFGLLFALVVFGDVMPLWGPKERREGMVPVSPTFAFAMLLHLGAAPAVLASITGSVIVGMVRGDDDFSMRFSAMQRAISLLAGALLLALLTASGFGEPVTVDWNTLLPIVVALAGFFVVSLVITSTATALTARHMYGVQALRPLRAWFRRELASRARSAGLLLSLAPVVALAAERHPLLLVLFTVPALAISRSIAISAGQQHQALHDELTGLPNRELLRDRIEQAIAAAEREGSKAAVLMLDLDGFKEVNDTFGHACGDALLREVGERLVASLRGVDTVARMGSDEFAVAIHGLHLTKDAAVVADTLREAVSQPFTVAGVGLHVEVSIGAALWPDHAGDADGLLRCAHSAMYRAKYQHGGFRLYAASTAKGEKRMQVLAGLREALHHGDLELHYQPQALLATGELTGVEALIRWRQGGALVPPDRFIPIAERSDLMHDITRYVIEHSLAQVRRWQATGMPLRVAVNLSARDLQDRDLPDAIERALHRYDLDPVWLELEISENSLMSELEQAQDMLERFRAMGIGLAIDDFGTGTTSLAHLPQMPVDVLKIDKSFVANLEVQADDLIVRTTIDLARSLGLQVVAEGVASEHVWRRLTHFGCHMAQGYYLCRPVPPEQLTAWLSVVEQRAARHQASVWEPGDETVEMPSVVDDDSWGDETIEPSAVDDDSWGDELAEPSTVDGDSWPEQAAMPSRTKDELA